MTLNDAIAKVTESARELGYSESSIRSLVPDAREMLYDIGDLTDETVNKFIEDHL